MIILDDETIVEQKSFPDGTLHLEIPNSCCKTISWFYENDAELFTLICIRKHFSNYPITLIMPYIPHARMDRVKNNSDVFTLKYFCDIINSLNFTSVCVLDAHSNVSLGLLNNIVQLNVQAHIENALNHLDKDNRALFFPDEGAMKRYSDKFQSYPFSFGIKKREWETGKILGLDIIQKENVVGKDVLIVDDICSRGGTFYYSAKALHEAGANSVSLYVSHCENTILQGEIFSSGLIKEVYTNVSLVHCNELIKKVIYV